MARCEIPSELRGKTGLSEAFFSSIRKSPNPIELTKEQVRNLVKNVGIDDARAIELRDGKRHIFGDNLKDIEEFNAAKGKVPKDTVVKMRRADTDTYDYFVSERKTDSYPSKWVVNEGEIHPNTDWTYVGKNATTDDAGSLKRFTRVSGNVYKEDPQGDVVLKVGRYFEGENPPPNQALAEQGYDAVRLPDGNFRVFDEATQAVDPRKSFIRDNYRSVDSQTTKNTPDEKEIQNKLEEFGLGKRVAATAAGALVGEVAAEDYGGSWLGGALGLALSMPAARNKIKGIIRSDAVEAKNFAETWEKAQKQGQDYWELAREGYRGDPSDEAAKQTFRERWKDVVDELRSKGQSAKQALFENDYIKSGSSQLRDLGLETANRMHQILMRTETAHNPYLGIAGDTIDKYFGKGTSLDEFDQIQSDLMREYVSSKLSAEEAAKASDEYLKQQMGGSIRRIITHEAQLDEAGQLAFKQEEAAKKAYSQGFKREQDRYILQTERGRRLVEAHREMYDQMGQKAVDSYQSAIDALQRTDLFDEASRVFQNFYDSQMSLRQWRKSVDDGWIGMFENVKSNPAFKEAVQFREQQLKIQNLQGRYVPQVQDKDKIAQAKAEFIQGRPDLQGASAQKQDEAWFEYFKREIVGYNREGFTVQGLSSSGMDVETVHFRTFRNALDEFRNTHAHNILDDEVRRQVLRDLQSNDPAVWQQYIGEGTINNSTYYYLKNPQKIQDNFNYNIVEDINAESLGEAQRVYLNMAMMRQSSFLDNPRNYVLPDRFLQNDMRKTIQQYARDVGVKTHLIDNGIGTQRQLQKYLNGVEKEAKQKGIDDVQDAVDKVQNWYGAITNTRTHIEADMSTEQIIRRQREETHNNKIARTVMNFAAMPFMWFTSFYAPFTPAILGSYLSSPRAIGRAYKEVLQDPSSLKNMTDNLYKYGAIQKKLRSISEEAQYGDISRDMLSGSDSWFVDSMYDISQRGIDFSTRFSLGKRVLSGLGVDPDNAGLLRLTTGDLYDISGAESAMVTMSVFRELEDMTEAGLKMLREGTEQAQGGGKTFRMSTIKRKLRDLGVENPERFIEDSQAINGEMTSINRFYSKLTGKGDDQPVNDYLKGEYSRIMDSVINQYHGRTKLTRPLKWVDNVYGRVLSQFSVYAQNFGVQTVRNRIYQPLKDWTAKHEIKQKDASLWSIYYNMQRGNTDKLQRILGDNWEEAYNDFPTEAVDTIFKVTPIALGAGVVMGATRDGVLDMVNMISNEAVGSDDYDAWERTKENFAFADELDDGVTGFDVLKATSGMLGQATHMGYFGRAGQVLRSAQYGSLSDATPATGMLNEGYSVLGEPFKHDWKDVPRKTSRALMEYVLLRSPIIGSFNGLRETAVDAVFNKPKNQDITFDNGILNLESL